MIPSVNRSPLRMRLTPCRSADAIGPARSLNRTLAHGEDHPVALPQAHDLGARLHARALLGQHELAAGKVPPRRRQQDRDLQRKDDLAVDVLMQAIVVARAIAQQQRRRPRLPGGRQASRKVVVFGRDSGRRRPSFRSIGWRSARARG